MPSEELFNDNQDIDFQGTKGKIKSVEANSNGLLIAMRKRSGEVKFVVRRNQANYQSIVSVVMLAYTLQEVLSLQLSQGTNVVGAGLGRLAVVDTYR